MDGWDAYLGTPVPQVMAPTPEEALTIAQFANGEHIVVKQPPRAEMKKPQVFMWLPYRSIARKSLLQTSALGGRLSVAELKGF